MNDYNRYCVAREIVRQHRVGGYEPLPPRWIFDSLSLHFSHNHNIVTTISTFRERRREMDGEMLLCRIFMGTGAVALSMAILLNSLESFENVQLVLSAYAIGGVGVGGIGSLWVYLRNWHRIGELDESLRQLEEQINALIQNTMPPEEKTRRAISRLAGLLQPVIDMPERVEEQIEQLPEDKRAVVRNIVQGRSALVANVRRAAAILGLIGCGALGIELLLRRQGWCWMGLFSFLGGGGIALAAMPEARRSYQRLTQMHVQVSGLS